MASNSVEFSERLTETLSTLSTFNFTMNSTEEVALQESTPLQTALSYSLTAVIALMMFGVGCGVNVRELKPHFMKPVGIVVGFLCQFCLMPLIAFALAKIIQMDDVETLALLIVGSCPGGTFSNVATYWTEGDLGLSVSMTLVSNTLGLGMMPLILFIYSFAFDNNLEVPFQTIGIALAALVGPIVFGMGVRYKKPVIALRILKVLSVVCIIAILGIVITALTQYGTDLTLTPWQFVCAAIFPGIGMALGYGLSTLVSSVLKLELGQKQRKAICIETGIQNTQVAGAIIHLSFPYHQLIRMLLFPVAYAISQMTWVALVVVSYKIYLCKFRPATDTDITDEDDREKAHTSSDQGQSNEAYDCEPPTYSDVESKEEYISKL